MKALFDTPESKDIQKNQPLAVRMRPQNLSEFVGQQHILGADKTLRKMIEQDRIPSLIFYGPPGCGKTALASVIARHTKSHFHHLNAVTATVADVREVIALAEQRLKETGKKTILFLDEIAHFNKLQQDALMKDVEEGTIILVGATTHNPYYYINTPLLSRSMVYQFNPLSDEDIKVILKRALVDKERGLGNFNVEIVDEILDYIAKISEGDARRALNIFESAVLSASNGRKEKVKVSPDFVKDVAQNKIVGYDRDEDQHYDTISAFIKSMRGSDPDAALYWLAKMIVGGEDPRFIARRMVIFASEDIGNADPQALSVATGCSYAVDVVGMPEARIILSQTAIYLATAPKSNSSYTAIESAIETIKKEKITEVPEHLTKKGQKKYLYPHDYPGHYVPQKYLPLDKKFYFPSDAGYEKRIKFFMNHIERLKKEYEKRNQKGNTGEKKIP
ncbi:MAG TPA: replication-associated recombination protein A [bacterium]|nr:replication-associated recombination protein A [bacterium]HPP30151.1 replication-associated recombination protein A [bacterium]